MPFEHLECGCWINEKDHLIIPVCEPHFQYQLSKITGNIEGIKK